MSTRKKRLTALRQNPKNVRVDVLDTILQDFGFMPDFKSGSHVAYRHPSGARVVVAAHGSIVPSYIVKQALKAIDEAQSAVEDDEDEQDD